MRKLASACPFCDETILRAQFAESEDFRAIYNLAPVLPGHSLVVSKQHHPSLMDLPENELAELMSFSRKVTRILCKTFQAEAFDWTIQDGAAAGQSVPHLHLHILPRLPADLPAPGDWYPLLQESQAGMVDSALRARLTAEQMEGL
jgi:bis(5'-adenosyl)-triphosphatase